MIASAWTPRLARSVLIFFAVKPAEEPAGISTFPLSPPNIEILALYALTVLEGKIVFEGITPDELTLKSLKLSLVWPLPPP